MDERGERDREEKLIGCRRVYGTPAAFSLTHHGRPITLTHARRGLIVEFSTFHSFSSSLK
jgi:hypothetical protein